MNLPCSAPHLTAGWPHPSAPTHTPAGIALGTFGVAAAALAAEGAPLSDLWPGYDNPLAWGIMIWSALGPGALAAFLHAKVGGAAVCSGMKG